MTTNARSIAYWPSVFAAALEGEAMKMMSQALLIAAAVSVVVSGVALAQSNPPAERSATPLPQYDCVLKTLSSCKADGSCATLDNLKGEKLPVKMMVDLGTGIVAGVDPDGWVNATRIGSLSRTTDLLILQGIDKMVAWQLLIQEKSPMMSLSLATTDGANAGFGDCTIAKEQ
jgi:hypothetical protein